MSTEEIIQRTRLLDSEIKVGSEAPSRCPRPHTQGRPWCSHRVLPRASSRASLGGVGTAVSSSDQKKRKERDGRGPGCWKTRPERGNGQTALPSLVWEVFLFRVCLLRNPHVTDEQTEAKRVLFFTAVRYGACNERQNLKPVFAQLKVRLFSLEYDYFPWRFPSGPPVSTFAGCGHSQAEHSESL